MSVLPKLSRREFLEKIAKLPLFAGIAALSYPLLRYLRPTVKPLELFPPPELPLNKPAVVATEAELATPWAFKEFIYDQETIEYTSKKKQTSRIPGYVVRLPDDVAAKVNQGNPYVAFQRICTHLGCIFQFKTNPTDVAEGFNYRPPDGHAVFACPCHLSVFDLTEFDAGKQTVGKVVSGPAPRPPRRFEFMVKDGSIVITGTEAGGIA